MLSRSHTTLSTRTAVSVLALAAGAMLLSGCVGYNVYPPMEGERGFTNVNSDPFPPLMTESLRWVVLRYPPNEHAEWNQPAAGNVGVTPFAINLPRGVNRQINERIVTNVGLGAQPMIPGNESLPIYHVARVWVKGDEAKVDIVRPVPNVAFDAQGNPVTQGMTLNLRGGMQYWRVTSHRLWSYGSMQAPALNYMQGSTVEAAAPTAERPPLAPEFADPAANAATDQSDEPRPLQSGAGAGGEVRP